MLYKLIKVNLGLVCCLIANAGFANTAGDYYFGTGYKHSFIEGRGDYSEVFVKNHPGLNIYIGYNWSNYLSVELGYDWTTRDSKHRYFLINNMFFGVNLTESFMAKSRIRFKNAYLDLNYKILNYRTANGLISVGIANSRSHVKIIANPNNSIHAMQLNQLKGTSSPLLRFGVGIQAQLTNTTNLRIMTRFENTKRIKIRALEEASFGALRGIKEMFNNGVSITISLSTKV